MVEHIVWEMTSADITGALGIIREADIPMEDVVYRGPLTIRFRTERCYGERLSGLLEQRGDRIVTVHRVGLSRRLLPLLRHPLLLTVLAVVLVLTAWLPTKVLFVRVQGNVTLPTNLILAGAEGCGIRFGAQRSGVRSEKVKNALLEAIPQLQWAGINTSGCVATIQVRERSEEKKTKVPMASAVVALRDGVIRTCTAEKGTPLCGPGQAVRTGQILISGLTDCGRSILVSGAEGEVMAETFHSLMVRTADFSLLRSEKRGEDKKISLLIGKKRINFYNDSGILDTTCVKMYEEYYITLPGGFRLPFGIAVETVRFYVAEEAAVLDTAPLMERSAKAYLLEHTTAGQILEQRITAEGNRFFADYICLESIGQNRYEEFTEQDGENDGENS